MTPSYRVVFLCTGNSARSIMAEALLNHWGKGRFEAVSAGSFPKGAVHPLAIDTLRRHRIPAEHLRSKSWNELAGPGQPPIDFVFTVCDGTAREVCPVWPGHPMSALGHRRSGSRRGSDEEKARAFTRAFRELDARIRIFTSLRLDALDRLSLQRQLNEIGGTRVPPDEAKEQTS